MIVERYAQRPPMIIGQQPMGMAIRMITIVSKNAEKIKHEFQNSNKKSYAEFKINRKFFFVKKQ